MTIVVCVDDLGGILFNRRRVSSDRAVISDILKMTEQHPLRIREYSANLFPDNAAVYVADDYLMGANKGDYLFLEDVIADGIWGKAERCVVYHWNRLYPSDVKFPLEELLERGKLESSVTFEGYSHSRITREVYVL